MLCTFQTSGRSFWGDCKNKYAKILSSQPTQKREEPLFKTHCVSRYYLKIFQNLTSK